MNARADVTKPDYRGMPLEDLDIADPRMFQHDYWHDLFARLRAESPVHFQPDSPAGPFLVGHAIRGHRRHRAGHGDFLL